LISTGGAQPGEEIIQDKDNASEGESEQREMSEIGDSISQLNLKKQRLSQNTLQHLPFQPMLAFRDSMGINKDNSVMQSILNFDQVSM